MQLAGSMINITCRRLIILSWEGWSSSWTSEKGPESSPVFFPLPFDDQPPAINGIGWHPSQAKMAPQKDNFLKKEKKGA